ncbi:MAG: hypothetical protein ACPGWR_11745 [Ardenticatenaceae bacterium]
MLDFSVLTASHRFFRPYGFAQIFPFFSPRGAKVSSPVRKAGQDELFDLRGAPTNYEELEYEI